MSMENALLLARPIPSGGPILDWIKEAVEEGEQIIKADPQYDRIDKNIDYLMGDQKARKDPRSYVSKVMLNETKRGLRRHVSALTDLKPVFAFKTGNPNFQQHGMLLNQMTVAWWINTFSDLQLATGVKYAGAAGSGDIVCEWDPSFGALGDIRLMARDPRDTIPIRPSRDGSIQSWYGCILKEAHSPNVMKMLYGHRPDLQNLIMPDLAWGTGVFTKFKRAWNRISGGPSDGGTLAGLNRVHSGTMKGDEIILYRCYINDATVNLTGDRVLMGEPGSSWSYWVEPGGRLYPRKRLIVCTARGVLYDGPNTYWHGMFPVTRLSLETWPWSFFGTSILDGTLELQDAINQAINDLCDKMKQIADPSVTADSRAVPKNLLAAVDMRKAGNKIPVNPGFNQAVTPITTGADIPAVALEFVTFLRTLHSDQLGTTNLDQLQAAAMSQLPAADSVEAFMNALSPELKLEGRQVEVAIRELADMVKSNFFQFYDTPRRIAILGDAGTTLADFDYDPGHLVPAQKPLDPQTGQPTTGYLPQLDADLTTREQRAQYFLRLFQFYVTPNSLLALNARTEQMKLIQLARMGYVDFWTLMEKLEVPNVGTPPPMPLPTLQPVSPDVVAAEQMAAIVEQRMPKFQMGPTGQILEMRVPQTITERLAAQQLLGIGMTENPAGRKASGQASPSLEEKPTPDGGRRITMTESHK